MFTIAICDDQQLFAKKAEETLEEVCALQIPDFLDYQIVPSFSSAREVLSYLSQHNIDLLFLDIKMPDMDGFALAGQLKELYPNILVVFISSHNELVYHAFFYTPVYFLRKSQLEQELPELMKKVIRRYLLETGTVSFQTLKGKIALQVNDILYLEAEHNYYNVHCSNGMTYKCRGTLVSMEETLHAYHFSRIQSAYLINIAHITIQSTSNAVLMSNGKNIFISRRRISNFKKDYATFIRRRTIV